MAVALGAIKGFLHLFTPEYISGESQCHVVTILDVLEPRHTSL